MGNVDPQELAKFGELAHRWWDRNSEFRPLHDMNPLRLEWIHALADLRGKSVLDIGCGGGILAESMAAHAAQVTGIDLAGKALGVARLHALESGVQNIEYLEVAAEALAESRPAGFDVVTCMEMLEHVPDPASVLRAIATLVRPGGKVFVSTINRNPKAYLMMILGAEYLLKMVPKGTHDHKKFITPAELCRMGEAAGLLVRDMSGVHYAPLSNSFKLGKNVDVNYMVAFARPEQG